MTKEPVALPVHCPALCKSGTSFNPDSPVCVCAGG